MKRHKRAATQGRAYKSKPKAPARASSKGGGVNRVDSLPNSLFLPNTHDRLAIENLRGAPIGKLPVDLLVQNDPKMVPVLREGLAQVYFKASQARELRRATKHQLGNATSGLTCLTQALKHLESVSSDGRSGLRFLNLAIAVFCGVDVFKLSEVEAAVTNVHEARLLAEGKKGAPRG